MSKNNALIDDQKLWQEFKSKNNLSEEQLNKFKKYANLLRDFNEEINLTNIVEIDDIIKYHFEDSLSVSSFIDFNKIESICDVGTGGGFPGVPLKIKFPHLNTILIEVNTKKISFLEQVVKELFLENIEICPLDWRTFLRTTSYKIDLFLSRASLHTDELMRVFKPGSPYNQAQLIYWASTKWELTDKEKSFFKKEETYKIGSKIRKLIFFNK